MGKPRKHTRATKQARPRAKRRRRIIPLAVAAAIGLGAIAWLMYPTDSPLAEVPAFRGGPRLAVDKELIDFGSVPFEKHVTAKFRVRNVGDQPLRIAANPPVEAVEGC